MVKNLFKLMFSHGLYIIADPADNSITFSRRLFKRMEIMKLDIARVYVFYIPSTKCYGFTINPELKQDTQLADIQYNKKHKCIGFECLCPTVSRILYDYDIAASVKCKLSVSICATENGIVYYSIRNPHGKHPL